MALVEAAFPVQTPLIWAWIVSQVLEREIPGIRVVAWDCDGPRLEIVRIGVVAEGAVAIEVGLAGPRVGHGGGQERIACIPRPALPPDFPGPAVAGRAVGDCVRPLVREVPVLHAYRRLWDGVCCSPSGVEAAVAIPVARPVALADTVQERGVADLLAVVPVRTVGEAQHFQYAVVHDGKSAQHATEKCQETHG